MNYCRRCGTPLTPENEHIFTCQNGHTLYVNPSPTVSIFLFDTDGNLLLSVRGVEPNKGKLDSFGGFLDGMESIEEAMVRELREELGLEPANYSKPTYISSASGTYDFGGETHMVVSNFFYATLAPDVTPTPADDVASIHRAKLDDIAVDDIGNEDVKKGFIALRGLLSADRPS